MLRPLLQQGISDAGLQEVIVEVPALKPERHECPGKPGQVVCCMSMPGG